jgi:hypothetical protein
MANRANPVCNQRGPPGPLAQLRSRLRWLIWWRWFWLVRRVVMSRRCSDGAPRYQKRSSLASMMRMRLPRN